MHFWIRSIIPFEPSVGQLLTFTFKIPMSPLLARVGFTGKGVYKGLAGVLCTQRGFCKPIFTGINNNKGSLKCNDKMDKGPQKAWLFPSSI